MPNEGQETIGLGATQVFLVMTQEASVKLLLMSTNHPEDTVAL